MAMTMEAAVEDPAEVIKPHPTLSDGTGWRSNRPRSSNGLTGHLNYGFCSLLGQDFLDLKKDADLSRISQVFQRKKQKHYF